MPQFIVTANKLNKRKVVPANLPEATGIVGIVNKGFTFEAVEADATEVPNDSMGKWYRDRDGNFYWGGAVMEVSSFIAAAAFVKPVVNPPGVFQFDPAKISWAHSVLKITDIWQDAKVAGRDVRVAVLDRGFDAGHSDLKTVVSQSFFPGAGSIEHGTNMTGMIGARGNKVAGIAPDCELFFAKVDFNNTDSIVNALQWVNSVNADIISMSFSCDFDNRIEAEFKKCFDKNIALIAAAGNAGELDVPVDEYPSSSPFCFAVGCFGKDLKRMSISNLTANLKLLAPGQAILTSIAGDKAAELDGYTSLATAFTSGTAALLLSVARKIGRSVTGKEIMETLCRNADKRNNGNDDHNDHYGFGLIDPLKTYLTIK